MTLIPSDVSKLGYKEKAKNYKLIMEFKESGQICSEIKNYDQKSAKSCQSSFLATIRRYGLKGIKVCIRGEKVYLVNLNLIDKH